VSLDLQQSVSVRKKKNESVSAMNGHLGLSYVQDFKQRHLGNISSPIIRVIINDVSDYMNISVRIAHIICNHPVHLMNLLLLLVTILGQAMTCSVLQTVSV
jgi:hypothetical protein